MASSSSSSPSNSQFEPPIIEQVITEFFAKSLHIILESRSPYVSSRNHSLDHFPSSPSSLSSSSSSRPRDKWFHLALRDCPAALENFDLWRQSNLEPLVVDVILIRRPSTPEATCRSPGGCLLRNLSGKDRPLYWATGQDEFESEAKGEKVVERWIVQYETRRSSSIGREMLLGSRKTSGASSHSAEIPALYKKTYKKITVMLRSLYVFVRLLPAYKVFRELNSSGRIRPISLSHKISTLIVPFTRAEDAEMSQFVFVPIDTPCGRLSLSVSYLPTLENASSEPSTPLSTQFIMDYVGSPTTDPLKRFQSLPLVGPPPAYVSVTRRHSWSNDDGSLPSTSPSPSPSYRDSRAVHCSRNPCLPPRSHLHEHSPSASSVPHNVSIAHNNNTSDEFWPSPPFSPTSSPSPPTHLPKPNALCRCESAPVSIPFPRFGRNGGLLNQARPPSPSPKGVRPGSSSRTDIVRAQITNASASQTSSTESKLPQIKKDSLRLGDFQSDVTLLKAFSCGKDEIGNVIGFKCSSPWNPFSRSSSRLSLLDEFDDSEFVYPFADDEDITDLYNRIELSRGKGEVNENTGARDLVPVRRSPDAAVGALVRMLKTAPPLQRDFSNLVSSSQVSRDESWDQRSQHDKDIVAEAEKNDDPATTSGVTVSGLFKSMTAADALEVLRSYKEMKELLRRKRGS